MSASWNRATRRASLILSYLQQFHALRRHWARVVSDARQDSQRSGGSRYVYLLMLIHRGGHELLTESPNWGRVVLYQVIQNALVYYPRHIELPFSTVVGVGLRLPHPKNITVNSSARIGASCTIYHNVTIGALDGDSNAAPSIGDNVIIGTGAVVLGPVTIGPGAKIGANAVVTRDVPAGATVVGANQTARK